MLEGNAGVEDGRGKSQGRGNAMERNVCSIMGCSHEAVDSGMCAAHFTAALVHGTIQYAHHTHHPQ